VRVLNFHVALLTFSHDGNQNKQGGHVTLMWLVALSSVIFSVLMWLCGTLKNPLVLRISS